MEGERGRQEKRTHERVFLVLASLDYLCKLTAGKYRTTGEEGMFGVEGGVKKFRHDILKPLKSCGV